MSTGFYKALYRPTFSLCFITGLEAWPVGAASGAKVIPVEEGSITAKKFDLLLKLPARWAIWFITHSVRGPLLSILLPN